MKRYILKRIGYALISLVLLSVTIFLFVRVLPAISIAEMREFANFAASEQVLVRTAGREPAARPPPCRRTQVRR